MPHTCQDCFYAMPCSDEDAIACHRYPPYITKLTDESVQTNFPLVNKKSWCGEWKQGRVGDKAHRTIQSTVSRPR